jgi:hypothetical protein
VDPITLAILAGGASSLAGGVFQWLNSRDAQKATEAERRRIQGLADQMQSPNFDTRDISPEDIRVLERYSPQIAAFVPEKSPELVKALSEGSQRGRKAQTDALDRFTALSQTGVDPLLQLEQARAQRQAAAQASSARQNIDEVNQRRGVSLGSGVGLASQMQAIQDAQLQQALAGEQANANAYQRQMLNIGNAANLGSQIRNEDVSLEERNAAALNSYNQRIADMGNRYNQYVANQRNDAQRFNQGQNQRAYEANIGNRYSAARDNQSSQNAIAQRQYDNRLGILGIQSGLSNQRSQDFQNRAALNNRAIQGLSDTVNTGALSYMDREDRLKRN